MAGTKQKWTGPGEDPRRLRELRTTRALLAGFKDHLYEALVTLTLATGLRRGEVLGLTWGDSISTPERLASVTSCSALMANTTFQT